MYTYIYIIISTLYNVLKYKKVVYIDRFQFQNNFASREGEVKIGKGINTT